MQKLTFPGLIRFLFFLFLVFAGLYFAKPFLVPVAFALLLAMLFLPLSRWLQDKGIGKAMAAVVCIFSLLTFFTLIGGLLVWQVSDLASDASKMEQNVTQSIQKAREQLSNSLGISPQKQQEMLKKQQSSGGGMSSAVTAVMSALSGIMVDTILVLVYLFLLLNFRNHLKQFVLKLTPLTDRAEAAEVMESGVKVAYKYLSGLAAMIGILWILYGIGFSIVGVKNALFFAVLCGVLEIVPFVGNLAGTGLTLLMGLTQGGGTTLIIGIIATYAIVQFVQTYLLEPLIVGDAVNINPLATIMGIVLAETVWGVPGMILAIPFIGITKIICDHVEVLKPYGFLLGQEKNNKEGFFEKLKKKLFKK